VAGIDYLAFSCRLAQPNPGKPSSLASQARPIQLMLLPQFARQPTVRSGLETEIRVLQ